MNTKFRFLTAIITALSVNSLALAIDDKCEAEAKEALKVIRSFNKQNESVIVLLELEDEDTTHDHLVTYSSTYVDKNTEIKESFGDTITMTLDKDENDAEKCSIESYQKGGA